MTRFMLNGNKIYLSSRERSHGGECSVEKGLKSGRSSIVRQLTDEESLNFHKIEYYFGGVKRINIKQCNEACLLSTPARVLKSERE